MQSSGEFLGQGGPCLLQAESAAAYAASQARIVASSAREAIQLIGLGGASSFRGMEENGLAQGKGIAAANNRHAHRRTPLRV